MIGYNFLVSSKYSSIVETAGYLSARRFVQESTSCVVKEA